MTGGRGYGPVCMLEKLPQALNETPSTRPLTKPQTMRSRSVCLVSMVALKWRERVGRILLSSVSWTPERETAVLLPVDQNPGRSWFSWEMGTFQRPGRSFGSWLSWERGIFQNPGKPLGSWKLNWDTGRVVVEDSPG